MLALPCCRCCGTDDVDCDGGGAVGAYAMGSDRSPSMSTDTAREAARNMAAILGAVGGGRLCTYDPGKGSPPRHSAAAQSRRDAAKNFRERHRGRNRRWLLPGEPEMKRRAAMPWAPGAN